MRRVLRNDGTCWVNIGDSYHGGGKGNYGNGKSVSVHKNHLTNPGLAPGAKPKDLCLVPARLALALQADGWWIRSEIIWAKKSPMPESVTDRPTSAHEKIWLMSKSKTYYYDVEAVREKAEASTISRCERILISSKSKIGFEQGLKYMNPATEEAYGERQIESGSRNLRNVWFMSTEPFLDAHFAVFPTEIPRRAIRAGTSEKGVCPDCGAPWKRNVEVGGGCIGQGWNDHSHDAEHGNIATDPRSKVGNGYYRRTTGWSPSCACPEADPVPATVLDPFVGSGTTALVAHREGRRFIGIDLKTEYLDMAARRIAAAGYPQERFAL